MHATVWLSVCNTQLENNVTPASLIVSKFPNIYLVLEKHLHSVKTPSVLTDLCFYLHTHIHAWRISSLLPNRNTHQFEASSVERVNGSENISVLHCI